MAVRLTDVLEQLGLTTGAAYNIWESQSDFRSDLAHYVANNAEWRPSIAWREKIQSGMSSLSASEAAQRLIACYVAGLRDLPDEPIIHYFWTLRQAPPDLRTEISAGLKGRRDDIGELYAAWSETFGLRVKEPYSEATVVNTLCTLIDGLVMRSRFDEPGDEDGAFDEIISVVVDTLCNCTEEAPGA